MSLVRAFTQRRGNGKPDHVAPTRAASQRNGRPVYRTQISSPVALISSTNALSYEAPDISGTTPIDHGTASHGSRASSQHTADHSDSSTLSIDTDTDASSVDNSPVVTPEPNHLSCYFRPSVDTKSGGSSPTLPASPSFDAPTIPQRVPSHSKKAHENLHRKRSVQRMMSPPAGLARRNSVDMFKQPVEAPRENPFGSELAQLDEVAEELSNTCRSAEAEADAQAMRQYGLACHDVSEYLSEIHSLIYDVYLAEEPVWI